MKIAPIDVTHKAFGRKLMGYDSDEVREFLRNIADEMETLIHERNMLKETLREKELSIMEYKERDEMLKKTISTATTMAEKIRIDADREAKLIVNDAQQKAEVIIRDARDSLKKTYNEISELKRIRLQFESNLKALAKAHLSMVEQSIQMSSPPT